jgi:hypothetical protein
MLARLESTPPARWISEKADDEKIDAKNRKQTAGGKCVVSFFDRSGDRVRPRMFFGERTMNNFISVAYAASLALSQALATFVQVRADQEALSNMTDNQLKDMMKQSQKAPIGFSREISK